MDYCPTHARAWLPPGWDLRHHRQLPGRWHPLTPWAIVLAQGYAAAFGCQPIPVELVPCDHCGDDQGVLP